MREIRVRFLYFTNGEPNITSKRRGVKLAVPSDCGTVLALRNILKKRIGYDDDYFMWWASGDGDISSYEGNGLG